MPILALTSQTSTPLTVVGGGPGSGGAVERHGRHPDTASSTAVPRDAETA
jgi:hypothetical protein